MVEEPLPVMKSEKACKPMSFQRILTLSLIPIFLFLPNLLIRLDTNTDGFTFPVLCTLMEVTNVSARSRNASASDTCSLGLLTTI